MAFAIKIPSSKQTASRAPARPFTTRRASGPPLGSGLNTPSLTSADSDISGLGFHVGHFDVKPKSELAVEPHHEHGQVTIKMPTAVIEADVCAKPTTDAAADELSNWTVGISRTLFEDYRFASYEKSYLFDRFSDSSAPALDIASTDAPFDTGSGDAPGSIYAAKLRDNPTRLEAADTAPTAARMANPDAHADCDPPDQLRAHIRLMDFSAYLLARNNLTDEVHTLAQAQYHQISEVRFAPRRPGFSLKFDKVAHGLPDINENVSRPPALGGSALANQLVEPLRFVETDKC